MCLGVRVLINLILKCCFFFFCFFVCFVFVSSFRSPESVEMDEIMAAMVLTSLSCSPVVQSPPQADPGPGPSHLPFHIVVQRH